MKLQSIKELIVDVPDFPKPGIIFKDITPILSNHHAFQSLIKVMAESVPQTATHLAAIESRGFILGAALAQHLDKCLVLVRKKGKLPRKTMSISYDLEYGQDTLEIQEGDLKPGDKVVIVDDVLATGGTAQATEALCQKMGAEVVEHLFLMELTFLGGRQRLEKPIQAIFSY
ncbi:MAG: adenine phosphoribosyltransferase [Bdellovibrionales bacterium]|nr:adenine phosphoribosyltransferase [Bdellovibrionales bacterium]